MCVCQCFILYSPIESLRQASRNILFNVVWFLHCNDFSFPSIQSIFYWIHWFFVCHNSVSKSESLSNFIQMDYYYYWSLNESNHNNIFVVFLFIIGFNIWISTAKQPKKIHQSHSIYNLIIMSPVACCLGSGQQFSVQRSVHRSKDNNFTSMIVSSLELHFRYEAVIKKSNIIYSDDSFIQFFFSFRFVSIWATKIFFFFLFSFFIRWIRSNVTHLERIRKK